MSVPPVSPSPPDQPPPPGPPTNGAAPRGFWRGRPKAAGAVVAGLALLVVLLIGALSSGTVTGLAFAILLVPVGLVGGTLALISRTARPYATGFLLTMGLALIVLGGACVAILSGSRSY